MGSSIAARMCGAVAVAGLALAGCVTPPPYGPIGPESHFGYRDTRNADGSYTLRVVTNNAGLAHEFWDRRARELCGGSDFQKNIFRAEIAVVTYSGVATNPNSGYSGYYTEDRYGDLILEGYLRCKSDAAPPAASPEDAAPEGAPQAEAPAGHTP